MCASLLLLGPAPLAPHLRYFRPCTGRTIVWLCDVVTFSLRTSVFHEKTDTKTHVLLTPGLCSKETDRHEQALPIADGPWLPCRLLLTACCWGFDHVFSRVPFPEVCPDSN